MTDRDSYLSSVDPEHRRWGRKYPRFPGVAECLRLIRDGKARGTWRQTVLCELAENASRCLPELVEAFRTDKNDDVRLEVVMALEMARLPEYIPFLAEVIREGDERFSRYAVQALRGIDTPDSRAALWHATHIQG